MNNILCATDLSPTSLKAVHYADRLAQRFHGSVTLLHVLSKSESQNDQGADARRAIEEQRSEVRSAPVQVKFLEGDFMQQIADESRQDHVLMVCATHGIRGLRQSLFGADILKLVRRVELPSLVVHGQSPDQNDFRAIVMPVAAHERIDHLLAAVCKLARAFGSTVHIYQADRPGEVVSEVLMANKEKMKDWLGREGVAYTEAEEIPEKYSIGFANSTIAYAQKVGAGCIAIMANPSDEFRYIAVAEKERMLTNEPGIPVLCAH